MLSSGGYATWFEMVGHGGLQLQTARLPTPLKCSHNGLTY